MTVKELIAELEKHKDCVNEIEIEHWDRPRNIPQDYIEIVAERGVVIVRVYDTY